MILNILINAFIGGLVGFIIAKLQNKKTKKELKSNNKKEKNIETKITVDYLKIKGLYKAAELKTVINKQIDRFENIKMQKKAFLSILNTKFDQTELTFSHFLGTVEQVYNFVLENEIKKINILNGILTIDTKFIENRIKELKESKEKNPNTLHEISALRQRRGLLKKSIKEIEELYSSNETILTKIDHLILKLSSIRTKEALNTIDLDYSAKELEKLTKNTNLYSNY